MTPANSLVTRNKAAGLVICNRQKTDFDSVCERKNGEGGRTGSRVYIDCDLLMKCVMRCVVLTVHSDSLSTDSYRSHPIHQILWLKPRITRFWTSQLWGKYSLVLTCTWKYSLGQNKFGAGILLKVTCMNLIWHLITGPAEFFIIGLNVLVSIYGPWLCVFVLVCNEHLYLQIKTISRETSKKIFSFHQDLAPQFAAEHKRFDPVGRRTRSADEGVRFSASETLLKPRHLSTHI